MSDIKNLADQLRNKINNAEVEGSETKGIAGVSKKQNDPVSNIKTEPEIPPILEKIRSYNNSDHKSMVHVRFDAKTLRTMNQFKMATGVDVTKLVAYSVDQLFTLHPELKTIIKQFIQNIE